MSENRFTPRAHNVLRLSHEAAESLADLKKRVEAAGWRLSMERGDAAEDLEEAQKA